MSPVQAAIPILAFIAVWGILLVAFLFVLYRYSKPINLHTRRFYLSPDMSLAERKQVLEKAQKEAKGHRFYNYYVILPDEEIPVFQPNVKQLAEAEFMIIEYLEPEPAKTQIS